MVSRTECTTLSAHSPFAVADAVLQAASALPWQQQASSTLPLLWTQLPKLNLESLTRTGLPQDTHRPRTHWSHNGKQPSKVSPLSQVFDTPLLIKSLQFDSRLRQSSLFACPFSRAWFSFLLLRRRGHCHHPSGRRLSLGRRADSIQLPRVCILQLARTACFCQRQSSINFLHRSRGSWCGSALTLFLSSLRCSYDPFDTGVSLASTSYALLFFSTRSQSAADLSGKQSCLLL